ncbi:unnamed protein product [Blepharisma stoltei]|uniref:Non-specific serine/threonine protein kinase n=1 Tax=Blepharisma stoltei TaxID=1481888 RepID=A0AAU9I8W6_9CILI|nr:unnamed protein product [Blepharisma stoltei]
MELETQKNHSLNDFELLKVIGKGRFGKVLLVKKKISGELFAMKILKKKYIEECRQIEHTRTERKILARVDHPYIVKFYYAFQSNERLYFILEYCSGGELFFHLNRARRFDEERVKFYSACLVLAIEHLHSKNIIYRDLKPENVLIDEDGFPKITDFGLSKEDCKDPRSARSFCGTAEYLAPEVIIKQGYGKVVDWWSLGCIIYEMLVGLPPFYNENKKYVYMKILSEDPHLPDFLSSAVKSLLSGLLNKDPNRRLGAEGADEIKRNPWFFDIDWVALEAKSIMPPFIPNISDPANSRYFSEEFTNSAMSSASPNQLSPRACSPTYDGFSYSSSPIEPRCAFDTEFTIRGEVGQSVV